jgi:phenylacetate-CoA ligase
MKASHLPRVNTPVARLYGELNGLDRQMALLRDSVLWSRKKVEKYELCNAINMAKHAYAVSPIYRALYDRYAVNPHSLETYEDYLTLPRVNKDVLRSADYSEIEKNRDFQAKNHANTRFYVEVAGEDIKTSKNIRLHGDSFPDELLEQGIYWYEKDNRTLVLSTYHLNEDTSLGYYKEIEKFRPDYIHAYPSALSLLTKYFRAQNLRLSTPISKIFCDCETLLPFQRLDFQSFYQCKVYNVYGHTEGSTLGITFPNSDNLFFPPVVGLMELLRPDGSVVDGNGERGEIVVTGFNNKVFPFVRYHTGDIGINLNSMEPETPNWTKIATVEGRMQDFVVDSEGRLIAIGPALFDYNFDWSGIDRFQLTQRDVGQLVINLVCSKKAVSSKNEISSKLKVVFNELFAGGIELDIKFVSGLEFTAVGKFRYLDQKLDLNSYF